jgi:REP element-mobilizing transposase RayT
VKLKSESRDRKAGMQYDPNIHKRRSIRLQDYDYSWPGWYYVTVCVKDAQCLFGEIRRDEVVLNSLGDLVRQTWDDLPNHYNIELDAFVVMPNHIHGVVILGDQRTVGAIHESPLRENVVIQRRRMLLAKVIGRFKMVSAKRINEQRGMSGVAVWQRNYYEHIIRNEADLFRIRTYIRNNPLQWAIDEENPAA